MMLDAYMAGMVDADGSVIISRVARPAPGSRNPGHRVSVQVTNVHRPLLEEIASEYGGSISNKPLTKGSFFSRKKHYNWSVAGQRAIALLERIRPHLRVKGSQAWLACEFWAQCSRVYSRTGVPPEEVALRDGFWLAMKTLKGTV